MYESNNESENQYTDTYNEEDISEMIEKLAKYPDNQSESTGAVHRAFRQNNDSENAVSVSVVELNSSVDMEYPVSFYELVRNIQENIELISNDNKRQVKKINKLHHDLTNLNTLLASLDKNIYRSVLIKLYENKLIPEDELIDKYNNTD